MKYKAAVVFALVLPLTGVYFVNEVEPVLALKAMCENSEPRHNWLGALESQEVATKRCYGRGMLILHGSRK